MNVILISLIGAVIILDKYAFGEFSLSQPLITGTIIGAFFGDISSGIFLGAMLQLIFLGGAPIGGDIPPDGQAAGVIGSGSYFLLSSSNSFEHSLFLAVGFALLGAIIGGALEIITRRYNEKLYHIFIRRENCLYACHITGLAIAFIRGLCLVLPFLLLASILIVPRAFPQLTKELLMIISISMGLANSFYLFIKKTTIIYLTCGVLCSLVSLVF